MDQSFALIEFFLVWVRTISKCLLSCCENLFLFLGTLNKISLLSSHPLVVLDFIELNIVLVFSLEKLFTLLIFKSVEILEFFLDLGNIFLILFSLLFDVIAMFLSLFELLADLLNFSIFAFNLRLEDIELLIDCLSLIIKSIHERLDLKESFSIRKRILDFPNLSKQFLFLLGLQGGGLIATLHFLNSLLKLDRVLLVSLLWQGFEYVLALCFKDFQFILDCILFILELLLLVSQFFAFFDLLLDEFLECKLGPSHLSSIVDLLLLHT